MMDLTYQTYSTVFKALSDETRLRIIDMLLQQALSACDIYEKFSLCNRP